jgi:hypothetical protein
MFPCGDDVVGPGRAALPLRLPLFLCRHRAVLPHTAGAFHSPQSQPAGKEKAFFGLVCLEKVGMSSC